MTIYTNYKVKIREAHKAFADTVEIYRQATDFFIDVCLKEWEAIAELSGLNRKSLVEKLTIKTSKNPAPKYPLPFYKMPSYLRRASIQEALGKVASYKSNLANWEANPLQNGRPPSKPQAGFVYPAMYRDNCFVRTDTYTARLKVFIRNTWDWIDVDLKKTDVDYIQRHCKSRRECVPTLRKRGKNWFLDFAFEEKVDLQSKPIREQIVLSVDLGINNACTCSAMTSDGTVIGRKFLQLPREKDCLWHWLNKMKKAQQRGAKRMPRMWARAKGLNQDIARKTAQFIVDVAHLFHADVIVFEHLNRSGKKRGSKKQRLHHWKSQTVQAIVTNKAHRAGMRISRICAWNTSKLAFDGSGVVERDSKNYSICTFKTGKVYNCDLSASYNIGARYFIREILKSLPAMVRLDMEAKVPSCAKRTTCTLATLLSLNAGLASLLGTGFLSFAPYRGKAV